MCRLGIKCALSTLLTGGVQAILQAACPSTGGGQYAHTAENIVLIITRTLPGKLPLHANAMQISGRKEI
jgi:hypothetical protein